MALVSWDEGRTKTLTISSGLQESDVLDMGSLGVYKAYAIGIITPAAFTGAVTIGVSDSATGTFVTLQSSAADVVLLASKGTVLDPLPFPYMKFMSDQAEGDDRDIVIVGRSG